MWQTPEDAHREALISWGVPAELLDFTAFNPVDELAIPAVYLPDDWTRDSRPSLQSLIEAMNQEVAVWFPPIPVEPIDLAWFGEAITRTTGLGCCTDEGDMRNLDRLELAANLRWLNGPKGETSLDLGRLTKLRRVLLRGPGLGSALLSPSLATVTLEFDVPITDKVKICPGVTELMVTAPRVDLDFVISQLTELRYLALSDVPVVSLAALDQLSHLEKVKVLSCRRVHDLAALSRLRGLKEVSLFGIRQIDDPQSLLMIDAARVEASGCSDIDEELAQRAVTMHSAWAVTASRRRRSQSKFAVEYAKDVGAVITFTDWAWLQATVGDDDSQSEITTEALESLLTAVAAQDSRTKALTPHYDSEGSAFTATVARRVDAGKLVRVWDEYLSSAERVLSGLGKQ